MDNRRALHRSLERQLSRLELSAADPPNAAGWAKLLGLVNTAYREAEADRYTMERSIEVSSEEMLALHEVLSRQARHDVLTGLPNRAALIDVLGSALARGRHRGPAGAPGGGPAGEPGGSGSGALGGRDCGRDLAVLFIDLDDFKLVNDSLGHSAGDELLLRAAERIHGAIRDGDVVARIGGDEFVVVCADIGDIDTATAVAQRISTALEPPVRIGSQEAVTSASIGIAVATAEDAVPDDLLRKADMAMYEAKAGGRGQFVIFDDDMRRRVEGRLATETALRHAITRHEFELHFQPMVRLCDQQLIGLEALVRWNRPGHGLVLPAEFVPVAEETRLISAIDAWVIETACGQFAGCSWAPPESRLAVNLSICDLRSAGIVEVVRGALQRSGLAPHRLVLELTEATVASGAASVVANLTWLQALGVRLAIDDFGTGYSSLSYLRQVPAQILKLDASFVAGLDEDEPACAIVGAIVTMGHALGLEIIAEGVERSGQARQLRRLGCDAAQGYLFAPPQPIGHFGPTGPLPPGQPVPSAAMSDQL
jgi:diguanylate cyclase (GGDEF)-like protein